MSLTKILNLSRFTAAQAAQKIIASLHDARGMFTAAQAAQKTRNARAITIFTFTAAQAAQK